MAENFEPYHVPQQSRRDKLRFLAQNHPSAASVDSTAVASLSACSTYLPFYDPSLLSSDLLTSHGFHLSASASASSKNIPICVVKEESMNFTGFISNGSSSSSTSHIPFNPSLIQDMNNNNNNPFLYNPQNLQTLRDLDQSYRNNGADDQVVVYKPQPSAATGQGLSLSLSSHNHPLGLNVYSGSVTSTGYVVSTSNDQVSRSSVPLVPFTGYASILKGSKFLSPAELLLEELCDVSKGNYPAAKITYDDDDDSSLMESPLQSLSDTSIIDDGESRRKKSRLISMLDEVYGRYKQYHQQMQAVVASFECVPGLGNATPYANLALKALSKHFRCLKNAITDQLQFASKHHGQISPRKDEIPRFGGSDRSLYNRLVHNSGFLDLQPVWRPQRGLPERAVTVLRAWLFEHFLHPYPTDTDKVMLARQTGLSRGQVSNWFINARVRLWKPMVEEIHMLETRQAQKGSQKDRNTNKSSDRSSTANSLGSECPVTFAQRVQDTPLKRTRSELADIPMGSEPLNLSYNGLSSHPRIGVGVDMGGGSMGGVSLTLGLHQNNGIGLLETFPINAAQRFGIGLEVNGEGYAIGGFEEAQNRHFRRDVIGGHLLHDFVG